MTSECIDISYTLSIKAEGEPPEILRGDGTRLEREGKTLLKLGEQRVQIEKDRVVIRRGYALILDKERQTDLLYPTPYGTLSMKVKTKKLNISPDGIEAKYGLYTAGELIHYVELKLKTERK